MRRFPVPISTSIAKLVEEVSPKTTLSRVQSVWPSVVGEAIASNVTPVSEQAGVLLLAARSSVWVSEVELFSAELIRKINQRLGSPEVSGLRMRVDPERF